MILRIRLWLIVSLATMAASAAVIVLLRPVWGVDFTGGTLLQVATSAEQQPAEVSRLLQRELAYASTVQSGEGKQLFIRTAPLNEAQHQEVLRVLRERAGMTEELRYESIGPTIGAELRRKALYAMVISLAVLIAYMAYTFRSTGGLVSAWKLGIAAIVALVHDLLFVTAVFVILGRWFNASIDTLFLTAQLAIFGYSVNDTIVIFNRFKIDWQRLRAGHLLETLDGAVRGCLTRSLHTAITTLLVLLALLFFGGSTVRWFVVALTAGTVVGAYSSLFVAPPVLYYLTKR
ncbi:MAG: protein translocase subunit SecF [Candidatus Andersenbacteria bacterium]|nr:protein translocase subunit SecF [Candidatus Andersenbacteria bacterium]